MKVENNSIYYEKNQVDKELNLEVNIRIPQRNEVKKMQRV